MLPAEVLRQIRRIQVRARRAVQTLVGGEYHSTFKGTGLSFEDVREYQPGDDVRAIDWNVTARMGQPFIKRYVEERELTILLVVDLSASLRFGSQLVAKRHVATEIAALIAFSAISNNDRVGFLGFSDQIEKHLPSAKGTRHVLRLLREIFSYHALRRGTDLSLALDHLVKVQKRRSIVFFLSDFLGTGHEQRIEQSFRRAAHKHDLIAVRLTDPLESRWPDSGLVNLVDAETGLGTTIDTSSVQFQKVYAARSVERRDRFHRLIRSANAEAIEVSTDGKHVDALLRFFRARSRSRRPG